MINMAIISKISLISLTFEFKYIFVLIIKKMFCHFSSRLSYSDNFSEILVIGGGGT